MAITQVFAPYLFLPLLVLLPLLVMRHTMIFKIMLAACLLVFSLRFSPHVSLFPPSAPDAHQQVTVLDWNMEIGHSHDAVLLQLLKAKHPSLVTLQEVDSHDTFAASTELLRLYPYQLVRPITQVPANIALLSSYPILEHGILKTNDGVWDEPQAQVLWARLDLGSAHTLVIVVGHPVSAINAVPNCYFCSNRRDAQLRSLNTFVTSFIKRGDAVLLVGDMNVTDREPGYHELTTGLKDSFTQVGFGSGHSWGFHRFNPVWPLLRIDYMLASPRVAPLALDVDCAPRGSDHCVLTGRFGLP
ncbi:MAG TPA: endonuclease/exonuclease/phosphatase family protein [Ktedonobacteraceae bacterium]|nr:endonuclease/exonuclease/phosphatase family protein [Ktedonobacteraceae bacterium]